MKVINYKELLLTLEQRFSVYHLLLLKLTKSEWFEFPTLCVSLSHIIKFEYPIQYKDWTLPDFIFGLMEQLPELKNQKPEGVLPGSYWWPIHDTESRVDAVREAIKECQYLLYNNAAVS